jgi:hypothetical protein
LHAWLGYNPDIFPSFRTGRQTFVAIFPLSPTLPARLIALRQGLLLAMLVALYLVLWQGPATLLGRALFVVHFGFFMLWQPFVHGEQRLSRASLLGWWPRSWLPVHFCRPG